MYPILILMAYTIKICYCIYMPMCCIVRQSTDKTDNKKRRKNCVHHTQLETFRRHDKKRENRTVGRLVGTSADDLLRVRCVPFFRMHRSASCTRATVSCVSCCSYNCIDRILSVTINRMRSYHSHETYFDVRENHNNNNKCVWYR